jgi:hypothetical protein
MTKLVTDGDRNYIDWLHRIVSEIQTNSQTPYQLPLDMNETIRVLAILDHMLALVQRYQYFYGSIKAQVDMLKGIDDA